jgi:hypothetical protein
LTRTPNIVLTTGKITTRKIKRYNHLAGYVFRRVQITTGKNYYDLKNYDRKKKVQLSGRLCFLVGSNYNRKKLRPEKKNRSQNNPPENNVVPVPTKIWRELAPYYFSADCFEKKIDPKTIRQKKMYSQFPPKFGGNWLHIIFRWIVKKKKSIPKRSSGK